MRISMVEFSPSGGLLHFAVQLGSALGELGHDVEIVTGPNPDIPSDASVTVAPILPTWRPESDGREPSYRRRARRLGRGVRHVDSWRRVLRHSRRSRPDVLQLANLRFALDGHAVSQIVRHGRARVVADVAHTPRPWADRQGDGELHKDGRSLRALDRAYSHLDLVVVLGEESRRELESTFPNVRRSFVMPLGADTTFDARGTQPAGDASPTILFFGNWNRYKGIDVLLEAFKLVREHIPRARLVLAGSVGADVDISALRDRADEIGDVDFRPGYVPDSDVPKLFQQCRVVAVPYRHANQSAVVRVAQRFERPVVATTVGDLPDAIRSGEDGLLVPTEDPAALADALASILENPREATRMGRSGALRAEQHASWASIAEGLAKQYALLLESNPERSP